MEQGPLHRAFGGIQDAAGLHRAVRVKLPMSSSRAMSPSTPGATAAGGGEASDRPNAEDKGAGDDMAGRDSGDSCGHCNQGRFAGDGCGGNSSTGGVGVIYIDADGSSGVGNRSTGCGGVISISCHANAMNESHRRTVDSNFGNMAVVCEGFSNLQPPAKGVRCPLLKVNRESDPEVAHSVGQSPHATCREGGAERAPDCE
ncbi:hypothetical protein Vafri_10501 [Volvox africanus]|uniref:Uncharacterized protein n=1 Tax=Volvox africanus TaxID=51714 RepID=A0A8J4B6F3_9CHLO|nr:hypothetical protein Vafri_10501 [Volvox africanus]